MILLPLGTLVCDPPTNRGKVLKSRCGGLAGVAFLGIVVVGVCVAGGLLLEGIGR